MPALEVAKDENAQYVTQELSSRTLYPAISGDPRNKTNGNSTKSFAAMQCNVLAPNIACGQQHEAN